MSTPTASARPFVPGATPSAALHARLPQVSVQAPLPGADATPGAGTPTVVNHAVPTGLADLVERVLTVDYAGAIGARWLVLPSGCFGLRVILRDAYTARDGIDDLHRSVVLSGVPDTGFDAVCRQPTAVLAVALTPLATAWLPQAGTVFDPMADAPATAVLQWSRLTALRHRLGGAATLADKVQAYLAWLETLFVEMPAAFGRRLAVAEAAEAMRTGRVPSIDEAARRVGVSRRQFERDFRAQIGMSPKAFWQVCTFQRFAQLAWQGVPLAAIAADLELTDQAHLNRAVKAMTGHTPATLLARAATSPMAAATRPHWEGRLTVL